MKKNLILHISDSPWGNAAEITKWHLERNFTAIGYHYVILNGRIGPHPVAHYDEENDGKIETGRPVGVDGAHVAGHNKDSIGVCLIGKTKEDITEKQLRSLSKLIQRYKDDYDVRMHHEFDPNKTCPGFDAPWLLHKLISLCSLSITPTP